jgi:hypothetical protein
MGGSSIVPEEKVRCELCGSLLFHIKYKHNGQDKIDYKCPSPHGLRGKKDFAIVEIASFEEIEEL